MTPADATIRRGRRDLAEHHHDSYEDTARRLPSICYRPAAERCARGLTPRRRLKAVLSAKELP